MTDRRHVSGRPSSDAAWIGAVLERFAATLHSRSFPAWRGLFASHASVAFEPYDEGDAVRCTSPEELWAVLLADGWETVYWVQASVTLERWASVVRTVTTLDDQGGTIWAGVDSFVFDDAGRILELRSHDNHVAGFIA